ncbi:hypothetical protein, partial [Paraburkholderia phenoliruptrix]|uniref:hypothetical protein n=1 Tax=Paraburkholderia phenoliruptrix TaxID=252970 RepID=UPI001C502661
QSWFVHGRLRRIARQQHAPRTGLNRTFLTGSNRTLLNGCHIRSVANLYYVNSRQHIDGFRSSFVGLSKFVPSFKVILYLAPRTGISTVSDSHLGAFAATKRRMSGRAFAQTI